MKAIMISFAAIVFAVQVQAQQLIRKDLIENWQFSQAGLNEWLPATVPGTVHTDLMANGKIKDPYFGIEEQNVQWIDKVDWTYKTSFVSDPEWLKATNAELVFEGLDTYATVWLNGTEILRADNMFLTWRVDVKPFLKSENELLISLRSPISEGLKKQSEYGIRLPAINDQSETGQIGKNQVSIFTRKAGYHYGWDWGPRLVPSGIWRPAYIEIWNQAKITDVFVSTTAVTGNSARLKADITVRADDVFIGTLTLSSGRETWLSMPVSLVPGENQVTGEFTIKNPALWWPRGYGDQTLYPVTCNLSQTKGIISGYKTSVGIRTLRLVQEPDADGKGKSFYFEVNGVPVFAKGANYIPNDVFLPRVTPEEYARVVNAAVFANMNMLRVWGGGIYENDIFYDLCDRAGILIWQDFMFACSMYPGTGEFLASVAEEARQNVIRLRTHPCIALWCGNNEIEAAWGPYDENMGWGWKIRYTKSQREMIWDAYDTIFHQILPHSLNSLTPLTPYWHSSPSAGMGILATNETRSGDNHYWGVWHQKHPFTDYNKYISRFMSEYGFQSFPEFDAVKKYTRPADWDIESPVMSSHQRSGIGNLRIREYMVEDYIIPKKFENFLYVSHLLQAEGIKMAIEAHRKNKPYCMGTLYWQLNDCWPVASWSGTDYYRNYKALHYFARKAYEPVVVIPAVTGENIEFRIVSDRQTTVKGILNIRVFGLDGKLISDRSQSVTISPSGNVVFGAQPVKTLLQGHPADEVVIAATLYEKEIAIHRNLLYLVKPKDLKLVQAKINTIVEDSGSDWIIRITADKVVKNVMITFNGRAGIFSDNYFDVLPGEAATIRLPKSVAPGNPVNFLDIKSLIETVQ